MVRVAKTTIETATAPVAPKQSRTVSAIIVLAVLLCLAIGIAGYFYYQYKHTTVNEADEIAKLTQEIGAVMELPGGETPTLATVTDKEKLVSQPFFQKAENGDKVLIYTNSGRAILYRPSTNWFKNGKIIDVTTVNVKAPEAPAVPEAVPTPTPVTENTPVSQPASPTVALYNGSTKVGVTNTLESEIKTAFPDVTVVTKDKAVKNDYQGNLVIDLSGKNADFAKKLAGSFSGTVGTLPAGEATPTADILIIVGNK